MNMIETQINDIYRITLESNREIQNVLFADTAPGNDAIASILGTQLFCMSFFLQFDNTALEQVSGQFFTAVSSGGGNVKSAANRVSDAIDAQIDASMHAPLPQEWSPASNPLYIASKTLCTLLALQPNVYDVFECTVCLSDFITSLAEAFPRTQSAPPSPAPEQEPSRQDTPTTEEAQPKAKESPGPRRSYFTIVLAVCCIILAILCIRFSSEKKQAAAQYALLDAEYKQLKQQNETLKEVRDNALTARNAAMAECELLQAELKEWERYKDFYYRCVEERAFWMHHAVIVTSVGEKYHTYNCPHIEDRSFWIYNVEQAIARGYSPCLDCDPPE